MNGGCHIMQSAHKVSKAKYAFKLDYYFSLLERERERQTDRERDKYRYKHYIPYVTQ